MYNGPQPRQCAGISRPMHPAPLSTINQKGSPGLSPENETGESYAHRTKRGLPRILVRSLGFFVLALSLVLTFVVFKIEQRDTAQQLELRFGFAAKDIADDVRERMAQIEEGLHASRAFVLAARIWNARSPARAGAQWHSTSGR